VAAAAVVACSGLVLPAASPDRPPDRAGQAGEWCQDEGGEQPADLVAGQRDQAVAVVIAVVVAAGCRSPFSASCARVAAR
jgi:hypothetical protein